MEFKKKIHAIDDGGIEAALLMAARRARADMDPHISKLIPGHQRLAKHCCGVRRAPPRNPTDRPQSALKLAVSREAKLRSRRGADGDC